MTSSEKYGTDKATIPEDVANFIYAPKTRNTNLRRHLHVIHAEEYDKAVTENKWTYKLSTHQSQTGDASTHSARNNRDHELPSFSPAVFLELLVRFVVADDQVSPDNLPFFHTLTRLQSIRVVECPEFRQLCMVLRDTLVDADIPRRDKMREAIISQWRVSFEQLKLHFSVGIGSFHCMY